MTNDKKPRLDDRDPVFSAADLKYILDVNQKAVEIYVEVEKQNDQILKTLEYFKEVSARVEEQLETIKQSDYNVEELLKDDNNHDHSVIIDMLKNLTSEMKTLSGDIKELQANVDSNTSAIEAVTKQVDSEVKSKISEIDKNLFRLVIILGSAGIGTIFTIVQTFLTHK